jgi:hypothetical protein
VVQVLLDVGAGGVFMRSNWLRIAAVGLGLALTACNEPDDPEGARPLPADASPAFPDEVAELRERIRQRLIRIQEIADGAGITGDEVHEAFFASDWDADADRLDALPAALREEAKLLRADVVRHDELVVAAYDAPAEGGAR